jgi:hypothetical protein
MFVILWEFEVKPGCEKSFESAYGPEGSWVLLFRCDPHYRMTRLLKDLSRPGTYLTMDFWDSESNYDHFKTAHHDAYQSLDCETGALTLTERHIGSFLQYGSIHP